ncbi:MAG: fluoride efflux transporter CrcB [Acidimicrobiaceae bacterium]|nr:fluoride efflux transporter CrcB [Acidimicrobiaceae bacterium]
MTATLVAIAGAFGCVIRFLFEYAVRRHHPTLRPWATVGANVLGTAITGYVAYRLLAVSDEHLRSIILTGFCGGLTTFSSAFAIPALLQREHHWAYSLALVVTTPLLCTAAFLVGMSLAH